MNTPDFRRQTDAPLYPKLLWSRPVTRTGAGRLLVVGGHKSELNGPTLCYSYATASGIGECRVLMPDSVAKLVGGIAGVSFLPSSPSGSLGRGGLSEILELSEDVDGLLIGGSLSNNSETSILLEEIFRHLARPAILYGDALEALSLNPKLLVGQSDHLLVMTMSEVFRLAGRLTIPIKLRRDGGLINKLEIIRDLVAETDCQYAVFGTEIIVASEGELTVTPIPYQLSLQPEAIAATMGTFWLQNIANPLAGLTMGAFILAEAAKLVDIHKIVPSDLSKAITAVTKREDLAGV